MSYLVINFNSKHHRISVLCGTLCIPPCPPWLNETFQYEPQSITEYSRSNTEEGFTMFNHILIKKSTLKYKVNVQKNYLFLMIFSKAVICSLNKIFPLSVT